MSATLHLILAWLLKFGAVALVVNEIRGLILVAPVMYGLWMSGGTPMAIWIAVCSLGGIALSVIVPILAMRKLNRYVTARA